MNSNKTIRVWSTISCDPDGKGNGYEASYDDVNKCVTIRRVWALDQSVEVDEKSLQKTLILFPNKGFKIGARVVYTVPACPDCNTPEIKSEALIVTVRKTSVEKLVINKSTNKQEKQYTEERTYDIQPDDDKEYIHTNCPERWLSLIK